MTETGVGPTNGRVASINTEFGAKEVTGDAAMPPTRVKSVQYNLFQVLGDMEEISRASAIKSSNKRKASPESQ